MTVCPVLEVNISQGENSLSFKFHGLNESLGKCCTGKNSSPKDGGVKSHLWGGYVIYSKLILEWFITNHGNSQRLNFDNC